MHETLDPAQVLEYNCLTMTNTNNTGAFLPSTYVAIAAKPVAQPLPEVRIWQPLPEAPISRRVCLAVNLALLGALGSGAVALVAALWS
jgi:hypothetical protein